jgi:hypothetical protein
MKNNECLNGGNGCKEEDTKYTAKRDHGLTRYRVCHSTDYVGYRRVIIPRGQMMRGDTWNLSGRTGEKIK